MLLDNRYEIISKLGEGGFGETFLVKDTRSPSYRKYVAKKLKGVANPNIDKLVKARFEREATILDQLSDLTNQVPKVYAYFIENGDFYLVQEWIDGKTLTQRLKDEGKLSEDSVKEILINLLSALEHVHSERIIHRDIKPDNVIVRAKDGQCILIDFGLVKEGGNSNLGNAQSSIFAGTLEYMPEEQKLGKPVFASDIYSLAMTAIQLLTGKSPQQLYDLTTGKFDWRNNITVTESFALILDKAVQPLVHNRYTSAKTMREALQMDVDLSKELFPLYGATIGVTTVTELAKLGKRASGIFDETGEPFNYYQINGLNFWYDEDDGIFDRMSMIVSLAKNKMPDEWKKLGLSWELSYNEWLDLLKRLQYSISIYTIPHLEEWRGYSSFRAVVHAEKQTITPVRIELRFAYGKKTTSDFTDSPNTLYSIKIKALK